MGGRGSSSMGSKTPQITTSEGMKVKAQVLHGANFFKADAISINYSGEDSAAYPIVSKAPSGYIEDTDSKRGAAIGFTLYSNQETLENQYIKNGMDSHDARVKSYKDVKYVWVKNDWVNNAKSTSLEKGASRNEKRGYKAYKIL